ncbi:MAG: T9SS type A sorting domain-containing protein [Bacteroidia bacterium]|nr:T9SS type A sorting domain-containing protein [Bacteroidia bacterium]MCF8425758.1 T9SS type A sorting domain-containing protein [Bacteroidia bacterium]
MKKLLTIPFVLLLSTFAFGQVVQFNFDSKVTVRNSIVDSLDYPFTGGLNAPQFSKIDLDGDGIKDLFVFDRVGNKVLTFLYKAGKYSYAPQYESEFPPLFKWVIIKDYNCDGKLDIFTEVDYNAQPQKDKYVSSNGVRVLRNESTVAGKFIWKQDLNQLEDMGLGSLPPSNIALANSDFSSFEDIDGDGDLDILQMPFGKNVITYYQNMSKEMNYNCDSLKYIFRDECWGYASYLVNSNGFYLNDNSACYRNYKVAKHNGTTLTLFDSDDDGDMDLIYGDVGFQTLVYLENGKTLNSLGRDSIISQDTIFPMYSTPASIEIFPASYLLDVDGDAKKDMLVAPNAEVAAKNKDMVLFYKNTGTDKKPVFTYQSNDFIIGKTFDLGGGSIPNLVDIDGDGDLDLVIATQGEFTQTGNASDRLVLYLASGTNRITYTLADNNFLNINGVSPAIQRIVPTFGDLTGDGKADLLIGDGNGRFHFYENNSNGTSYAFTKKSDDFFGMYAGVYAAPQLVDLNKDGKLDIVSGRKNGTLVYFENSGSTTAPNFTSAPTIDSIGKINVAEMVLSGGIPYYFDGYSIPHVCDLDKDGNYEILVGSEQGRLFMYRNFDANANRVCDEIENVFSDGAGVAPSNMFFGPKVSAFSGDVDKDGIPELFIGNSRGGLRLYSADIKGVISGVKETIGSKSNLVVYPNPAHQELFIRSDRNLDGMSYSIYDILGNSVQTGKLDAYQTNIDLTGIQPGFYLLNAIDVKGNQFVAKFLVE